MTKFGWGPNILWGTNTEPIPCVTGEDLNGGMGEDEGVETAKPAEEASYRSLMPGSWWRAAVATSTKVKHKDAVSEPVHIKIITATEVVIPRCRKQGETTTLFLP